MIEKVNIGQDFLEAVKGYKVVCFEISVCEKKFILKKGYTKADFNGVVKSMLRCKALDSKISGTIWCKKGIWFSRIEKPYLDDDGFDFINFWAKYSCPKIPEYLSWFCFVVFMSLLWLLRLFLRNGSE